MAATATTRRARRRRPKRKDLVFAASAAAEANLARALHDGGAPAAEVLQKIEYSVGLRRALSCARVGDNGRGGGRGQLRAGARQSRLDAHRMHDEIAAGRRVLLSALQAGRVAAHVPTLRAVLTNLIMPRRRWRPHPRRRGRGRRGGGRRRRRWADEAISRAETDGFVEELDALRARTVARWRGVLASAPRRCDPTAMQPPTRRRSRCVCSVARTASIGGASSAGRGATRAARSAWLRWPVSSCASSVEPIRSPNNTSALASSSSTRHARLAAPPSCRRRHDEHRGRHVQRSSPRRGTAAPRSSRSCSSTART